jgi:predicted ATPase
MGRQRWIAPQFVGRADELGLLDRALLRASGGGTGQCVFVEGEAGIGKSRLLTELRVGFTGYAFEGRCYEEDAAFPFAPMTAGLRGLLVTADQKMAAIIERRADDLVRLLPGWADPNLSQPASPATDPAASQRTLFEALAGLFFDMAAEGPLLVLFEDLHWSDESTVGLLRFLARRLARHRMLLIGTYRPDEKSAVLAEMLFQLRRKQLVQEITLGPLPVSR